MTRIFIYFLSGFCFVLLQTALFPHFLPAYLKPDLLLILVIYLGLTETYLRGGILAYVLGCLLDVFSGNYPGLYGLALLTVFLAVRGAGGRLNTESSLLLLFMVFCGTLLEAGLLIFPLGIFADAGPLWPIVLGSLFPELVLNLIAAFLLLKSLGWWQKRFMPHSGVPGLQRLDSRYEP